MGFLGIGSWEILLIIVLALIVLGPAKLTDFARTLGKTVRAIRKASTDLTSAVNRELDSIQEEPTKEEKQSQPPSPDASEQGPEAEKTGPTDRERHP
ncbi:MAG: twin-arginine translocase TatA/TatE family subunit [Dehalococcoidales bacterium]|nr:twin-arginine translocase TatA/TatE family subunit [Dehalococcoidales bacterium]